MKLSGMPEKGYNLSLDAFGFVRASAPSLRLSTLRFRPGEKSCQLYD